MSENTYTQHFELPSYHGKNTFGISNRLKRLSIVVFMLGAISKAFFEIYDNPEIWGFFMDNKLCLYIIIAVLAALLLFAIFFKDKKVIINAYGIILVNGFGKTKQQYRWQHIQTVGISRSVNGGFKKSSCPLFFSIHRIKNGSTYPLGYAKPGAIWLPCRPKAIHCTLEYWNGEIQNLEKIESWQKYLNKIKR